MFLLPRHFDQAVTILKYAPILKWAGIRYANETVEQCLVFKSFGIEDISRFDYDIAGQV